MKKLRSMFLCPRTLTVLFVICGAIALQSCSNDEEPAPVAAPEISIDLITSVKNDGNMGISYGRGDNSRYDKVVMNNVHINLSAGKDISKVEIFIDKQLIATLTSSPYQFTWDSHTVKNGYHTIKALATNTANNAKTDYTVVKVENNP